MSGAWAPRAAAGRHPALADPWDAAAAEAGAVLAVLMETEGPAYRDPGAAMAILPDGRVAGAITSGCVEADLLLHAAELRRTGRVRRLRYGRGSPFMDLRLPCGGGIEVLLFPAGGAPALSALRQARAARRPVRLQVSAAGRLRLFGPEDPGAADFGGADAGPGGLCIDFVPPLRVAVLGAGPEAAVFAGLSAAAGQETLLLSHDGATLDAASAPARRLARVDDLDEIGLDARSAAVLFYHDHDYEPPLLLRLLRSPAFYIGAQGSRATHRRRCDRLRALGAPEAEIARIRGPIGLFPSSRDPQALAVSVLAEIAALQAGAPGPTAPGPIALGPTARPGQGKASAP